MRASGPGRAGVHKPQGPRYAGRMHRWLAVSLALPLLAGCAATVGSGSDPQAAQGSEVRSLPRYLTLELPAQGQLELDGRPVSFEDLARALREAWSQGEFEQALLWADAGTAQARVQRAIDAFLVAGIDNWRFAWRGEQQGESAAGEEAKQPASSAAPTAPSRPAPAAAQGESAAQVRLKTVGLHIGGGPNDDATRDPLIALFESQFPALTRCAEQIEPRLDSPGSFGIDLYVGPSGGIAEARQVRTRLGPEGFRECVKRVLTGLDFPAPKRPLVISYSLAFAPISAP